MPMMPPTFRAHGQRARQEVKREADQRRGSARARGYGAAWDKASKGHLDRNPLCLYCTTGAWGEPPRDTPATLTDHLYPHRGDQTVFWLKPLWVASCAGCHNGPKQAVERQGQAALDALARRIDRPTLTEALPGG